jgi:hypothetical protein
MVPLPLMRIVDSSPRVIGNGSISLYVIKELLLPVKWSVAPESIYQIFVELSSCDCPLRRALIIDFMAVYALGYTGALGSEDASLLVELVSFPLES